jgi:hypothetical protein
MHTLVRYAIVWQGVNVYLFIIVHIAFQILPKCLFAILSSLEKDVPDSLDILALVEANKPLKPLVSMELKFVIFLSVYLDSWKLFLYVVTLAERRILCSSGEHQRGANLGAIAPIIIFSKMYYNLKWCMVKNMWTICWKLKHEINVHMHIMACLETPCKVDFDNVFLNIEIMGGGLNAVFARMW